MKRIKSNKKLQLLNMWSGKAMYKTRNTGTGNVAKHSGECHQILRGMLLNIPGNVTKHSGECHKTFRGMSSKIPGNVAKHSRECCQFLV